MVDNPITADSISGRDSLADTPFSELFHEARTTSTDYSGVAVAVRTDDAGHVTEVGDIVKERQGEHYHVRDTSWDAVVTLPVQPFMDVRTARQEITRQLRRHARHAQAD